MDIIERALDEAARLGLSDEAADELVVAALQYHGRV